MPDSPKTTAELLAAFADNNTQNITPQDMRNLIVTMLGGFGCLLGSGDQTLSGGYLRHWNSIGAEAEGITLNAENSAIMVASSGLYLVGYSFSVYWPNISPSITAGFDCGVKDLSTLSRVPGTESEIYAKGQGPFPVSVLALANLVGGHFYRVSAGISYGSSADYNTQGGAFFVKRIG